MAANNILVSMCIVRSSAYLFFSFPLLFLPPLSFSELLPRRRHDIVEDGHHGHADHPDAKRRVVPLWRLGEDVVEDGEHVPVVSYLSLAGRIIIVRLLQGHLVPHLVEVHEDARVPLNELLEFLDHGDQRLRRVLVDMGDVLRHPVVLNPVVGWKPGSEALGLIRSLVSPLAFTSLVNSN